jgi:aerobic carbon-monoxide dehydrogenase small subunit
MLTVNGRRIGASVEPRTHLADFLREHCRLTGTHLGCEHGVCGACTVLVDSEPVRACISFAVACDGCEIRTIEGFDDDPLMQQLREAFTREHALQCGFCTPGMLIAARDIVQRLPGADEERIRVELSGNLCRCTGYLGIVNAVRSVAAEAGTAASSGTGEEKQTDAPPLAAFVPTSVGDAGAAPSELSAETASGKPAGVSRFEESFVIGRAPGEVWRLFADLPMMAACLPGARLTEHDARSAKGAMTVKLGPIAAAFGGSASVERDGAQMRGVIRGAGNDPGSGSRTRGEVVYRLAPENDGKATRVFIVVEYTLQGMLAQFSRGGLVQELGRRLVTEFAQNLNDRLAGTGAESIDRPKPALNVGHLFWHALRERLRRLIRSP